MADYGRDLAGVTLTYALREVPVNSRRGVAESCARRLMSSLFYDDDYGYDLRELLNSSISSMGAVEARIEDEMLKDERVRDADATLTFNDGTETLTVGVQVTCDELGSFDFTLEVSALTVELVSVGG